MTYTCTLCRQPCRVSTELTSSCCDEQLADAGGVPLSHAEFDDLIMRSLEQMPDDTFAQTREMLLSLKEPDDVKP